MNKKLIAILCAVMLPVSMAFADLASDLAGGSDAATALTNEVMALMAADPTLSADEANEIASANLVSALIAAGSSPSEAAATATAAGANESVANSTAATATAAGDSGNTGGETGGETGGDTGSQNAGTSTGTGTSSSSSTPAGGEPGSGQEDETEDNSYGKQFTQIGRAHV